MVDSSTSFCNNSSIVFPLSFYTCGMFHLWLISATGSVAVEQPHPIRAIFKVESNWKSSKKASRESPRVHYNGH